MVLSVHKKSSLIQHMMGDGFGRDSILKVQRKNPVGIPWFVPYPVINPCFVLYPVGIPLVYYFHALCRSCKFTWFLLSSKKDRMRFRDASEEPYALRF